MMAGLRKYLLGLAVAISLPSSAFAITCAGVEARVNARTSELELSVLSLIQTQQAALVAAELSQRARILSALGVLNRQQAYTGNQDATVRTKAEEASASAIVAAQTRMEVLDRTERFGDVGYNACAIAEQAKTLTEAMASQRSTTLSIMDRVINKPGVSVDGDATEQWYSAVSGGDYAGAHGIFSGDLDAAAEYINWVMGPPPTTVTTGNSIEDQNFRLARLQGDSLRSVSLYLLSSAAASAADGGVNDALDDLSENWIGADGGMEWSAKMAASPLRAVLLDMARTEAANLTAQIIALQKKRDLELGMATYSLARTEAYVSALSSSETLVEARQ